MSRTIRAAAVQLAVGTDLEANLAACVAGIERAAERDAHLIVLPEFCNHLSWYDGPAHCYEVAVGLGGRFVSRLAVAARAAGAHVVVNCTVRRGPGVVTGTSLLLDPRGAVIAEADKQVLIGHENDFLRPAQQVSPVVDTPLGRLGMYACMDGVINETPRGLALRGAQILCNSLNSFALDEGSLHIPVRAAENRVFVVAANKVGPLIPEPLLAPVSEATSIPTRFLVGAGDSQLVAPDGRVLARAPRAGDAVVVADVEPAAADDKRRPDGTDVVSARRPALYGAIAADPATQPEPAPHGAAEVIVAVARPARDALSDARALIGEAAAGGARLIVLPELVGFDGAAVDDAAAGERRSLAAIEALAEACPAGVHVVTSVVGSDGGARRHLGVVIGPDGVVARQPQLHACARHPWAVPGDSLAIVELPWARLGVAVGPDSIYPETFRLLALRGAEIVAVPLHPLQSWELELGLVERSAENRVNLVAASRGGGVIAALQTDFTIMTPWRERAFDGLLSHPVVTRATGAVTLAPVHPRNAANKLVSHRTDLLRGRPWALAAAITQETPHD